MAMKTILRLARLLVFVGAVGAVSASAHASGFSCDFEPTRQGQEMPKYTSFKLYPFAGKLMRTFTPKVLGFELPFDAQNIYEPTGSSYESDEMDASGNGRIAKRRWRAGLRRWLGISQDVSHLLSTDDAPPLKTPFTVEVLDGGGKQTEAVYRCRLDQEGAR